MSFLNFLISGISLGSIYAIIALGYTMVYGIAKMLNFAHGDVIMVGAYVCFFAVSKYSLPPVVGILLAVVVCTVLGIVVERLAYKPLRAAPSLAVLITAIGVSYFLQNAALLLWTSNPKVFPSFFSVSHGTSDEAVSTGIELFGGQLKISYVTIVTIVACLIIMVALSVFVGKTKMGKAMRATAQNRKMAMLLGIDADRIISLTFIIGSFLAAVGALLYFAKNTGINHMAGSTPGIKAFIAAVLGGIGIIPGAMLGGILIGLIEIFVKLFAPGWYEAVTYGTLIVILLVKPSGILGKNVGEKV